MKRKSRTTKRSKFATARYLVVFGVLIAVVVGVLTVSFELTGRGSDDVGGASSGACVEAGGACKFGSCVVGEVEDEQLSDTCSESSIWGSAFACCFLDVGGGEGGENEGGATPGAEGYHREITINSQWLEDLEDWQVVLDVDYSENMEVDFSDLRFYDAEGVAIPFWIERHFEGENATVWLKVDNIVTHSGMTAHMYYGDTDAEGGDYSGKDVFVFFSDFVSGDTDGWTLDNGCGSAYYSGEVNLAEGNVAPSLKIGPERGGKDTCLVGYKRVVLGLNPVLSYAVKLDSRAKSGTAASSVTNSNIATYAGSAVNPDARFKNEALHSGATKDTGWSSFGPFTDMIPPGQSSALFYLYLNDAWIQPHAITAWWDNIILYKYIPVAYFVEIGDEEVVVVDDLVEPNGTESNGTDTGNDSVLTSSTFSVVPIKNYNAVIGEAFTLQVMLLNASANETYVFSDNTTLFEIGNETGLINFTPGAENNGTYGILVKAMNGSLNKTASFAMGVIEANSSDNDSGVVVETCTSLGYACVVDGGCGDGIRIYAYDVDCDIGEICCGADTGDDDITFDPYDGGDDDDDSGDGMGMVTWILIAVGALAVLGGGGFAVWKFVLAPKGILSGGEGGAVGAVSGAAMSADAQLKKLAEQG